MRYALYYPYLSEEKLRLEKIKPLAQGPKAGIQNQVCLQSWTCSYKKTLDSADDQSWGIESKPPAA